MRRAQRRSLYGASRLTKSIREHHRLIILTVEGSFDLDDSTRESSLNAIEEETPNYCHALLSLRVISCGGEI